MTVFIVMFISSFFCSSGSSGYIFFHVLYYSTIFFVFTGFLAASSTERKGRGPTNVLLVSTFLYFLLVFISNLFHPG